MADKTTTEQINAALRELDRAMPDVFATIDVHLHGDINRPDNILKTINSACVYVEGGYWFRGATLDECMAKFRQWHAEQGRES